PDAPETPAAPPPPPTVPTTVMPPTLFAWELAIVGALVPVGSAAWLLRDAIGLRGQAVAGVLCFFGLVAMFSKNLRAVNWRTIAFGFGLQLVLAVLVLKVPIVYQGFEAL